MCSVFMLLVRLSSIFRKNTILPRSFKIGKLKQHGDNVNCVLCQIAWIRMRRRVTRRLTRYQVVRIWLYGRD